MAKRVKAQVDNDETALFNGLTVKQEAFCVAYADCLNATEAARRAGYAGTENALAVQGYDNLRKPHIKDRIGELIRPDIMTGDEILFRLSQHARGNIIDCFDFDGSIPTLNLKKAQALNVAHMIKSIRYNGKTDSWSIELFDQQKALDLLGKYHQLFSERVEHDGKIDIRVIYEDS